MDLTLVREDRVGLTSGVSVVPPGALQSSYVGMGYALKAYKRETRHKMRFLLRVVRDDYVDRSQV